MPATGLQLQLTLLVAFLVSASAYLFLLEPWGHDTCYHLQRILDIEGQLAQNTWHAHFADNAAEGRACRYESTTRSGSTDRRSCSSPWAILNTKHCGYDCIYLFNLNRQIHISISTD